VDMLLKEMSGGHVIKGDVWWTCYKRRCLINMIVLKDLYGGHVVRVDVL